MNDEQPYVLFDSLQFPLEPTRKVPIGQTEVRLYPYQTIVWVSIWPSAVHLPIEEQMALAPNATKLPAVLDTGSCATLSLSEKHLEGGDVMRKKLLWSPDQPRELTDASGRPNLIPKLHADLLLHAEHFQPPAPPTYRLPLGNEGISVYTTDRPLMGHHLSVDRWNSFYNKHKKPPEPVPGPRLPILGLRALAAGNLKVEVICNIGRDVNVRIWLPTLARDSSKS